MHLETGTESNAYLSYFWHLYSLYKQDTLHSLVRFKNNVYLSENERKCIESHWLSAVLRPEM